MATSEKQMYFDDLIQQNNNIEKTNQILNEAVNNVESDLKKGQLSINEEGNLDTTSRVSKIIELDRLVHIKKKRIEDQMKNLDQQLTINKQILTKAKRQISHLRSMSQENIKETQASYKARAAKLVAKWANQKEALEKRIKYDRQKKEKMMQELKLKEIKEEEAQEQFYKMQKRKLIEMRMREAEERRAEERKLQSKKINTSSTHTTLPKYVLVEKLFQQKIKQQHFQEQVIRKNHQMTMALNAQAIKQHQKAYLQKIKARFNKKPQKRQKNKKKKQENNGEIYEQTFQKDEGEQRKVYRKAKSEFDLYLNRKDEKIKDQLQKMKRRQKFQQRINKIHIKVDSSQRVQRQIQIDKSNNPFKYHFLSQKALTDQQIYRQFPNFNVDIDPRQLGKQYLQKLKEQPRLRVSRSSVLNKHQLISERPIYKNYLAEVRVQRPKKLDEVEETKKLYKGDFEEAKRVLNKKSQNYQNSALKKIKELKNTKTYDESIKKQSQIDQMYMKSLKARIACLQIS